MKYIWLVLFLAAVFGLCFFADRCIGKVQARAQRRPAVRLPLRYPLLCVLLLLVAPVSAWYGITHAAPLFVAGAVLLAGIPFTLPGPTTEPELITPATASLFAQAAS